MSYFNASNLVGVIAIHDPETASATWLPWLLTSIFICVAILGAWIIIGAARYLWPVLLAAWAFFVAWFLAMYLSAVSLRQSLRTSGETLICAAGAA